MKVALASGEGHTELENLLRMLEIPQERNRVLHSLGYSANRDVLSRVLTFSLDPRLRDQESVMVIESVCQNRIGVRLAWDFFKVGHHHIFVPYIFSFVFFQGARQGVLFSVWPWALPYVQADQMCH